MQITRELLEASSEECGWYLLPDRIRIHCSAKLGNDVNIGYGVSIGGGVHIGNNVRISRNIIIENRSKIGNDVCILEDTFVGSKTKIGSGVQIDYIVYIGDNVNIGKNTRICNEARIPHGVVIPDGVEIRTLSFVYAANYAGKRNGEDLFRLGCETRPLSWFTSRRENLCQAHQVHKYIYDYISGWERVWDQREMSEEEYRLYLRFFKIEAKRLGL